MTWWNASWGNRFEYVIPNEKLPDGESLTDFPLHIPLTTEAPAGFWAHVKADGSDIRIVASDDETQLEGCHLEGWDHDNQKGHIWVKDTIPEDTDSNTHWVYVYYGNGAASADWDKPATYNAGYGAAYHFDEAAGHHLDATGQGRDSTAEVLTQQGADIGKIDGADEFDGANDRVTIPTTVLSVAAGTISMLVKKHAEAAGTDLLFLHYNNGHRIYLYVLNGQDYGGRLGSTADQDSGENLAANTDYHCVLTWDGSTGRMYLDGLEVHNWEYANLTSLTTSAYIGSNQASSLGWNGVLDEVRISKGVARSAEWVAFACLSDKGEAGTAGSEEELAALSFAADAILKKALAGSFTADAYLASVARAIFGDAILKKALTDSFTADARLASAALAIFADAVIFKTQQSSIIADAILKKTESDALDADAVVFQTSSASLAADGVLFKTISDAIPGDAYLTYGVFADGVIFKTQTASFSADAIIFPIQHIFMKAGPIYIPVYPLT